MNLKANSEAISSNQPNYELDAPMFQRGALFGGLAAAILGAVRAARHQAMKHLSRTYRATVSALSDRHPSVTRGLALIFFLAGLILCLRML